MLEDNGSSSTELSNLRPRQCSHSANSYFISDKVKNWTFRNNICRIAIPLGVAYGSDPRQVQDLCSDDFRRKHPEVLAYAGACGHAR